MHYLARKVVVAVVEEEYHSESLSEPLWLMKTTGAYLWARQMASGSESQTWEEGSDDLGLALGMPSKHSRTLR